VRVIPPTSESADRGVLTVAPDRRRRLSQGVLVEASILARLLGLRLLRLEATLVLIPADVTTRSAGPPRTARWASRGRGLPDAVREIDEGAKLLEQARNSRR
jgi:hypothetical protein